MKKFILIPIIVVLTAVLVVSIVFISSYYNESHKQKSKYDELASLVETSPETSSTSSEKSTTNPDTDFDYVDDDTDTSDNQKLNYRDLPLLNADTVGWIRIDGTAINYPVVQSKSNPNFYLYHNFYKQESVYGCPFVQDNCDANKPTDNVVIYGHHMNDGSMFAEFANYSSYDFYTDHKYIQFDTLHENHRYEVLAAFKTEAQTGFRYYSFVNASSDADYNAFVSKCKSLSYYDTGVTAKNGDKLITLSTCDNISSGGRIVVVAKQIS